MWLVGTLLWGRDEKEAKTGKEGVHFAFPAILLLTGIAGKDPSNFNSDAWV